MPKNLARFQENALPCSTVSTEQALASDGPVSRTLGPQYGGSNPGLVCDLRVFIANYLRFIDVI
ncbi:hypothetical protein RRG08_011110 [Elysia crispata]|uniref:Uncharacterized protein n=1 Tax=Elysia crispata TaxID=231223 RepID=A0AAE1DR00_9GAST|nr:hypothetical protein RRG08_011110 [Elysia crispata]